jgi:hypothetical protein
MCFAAREGIPAACPRAPRGFRVGVSSRRLAGWAVRPRLAQVTRLVRVVRKIARLGTPAWPRLREEGLVIILHIHHHCRANLTGVAQTLGLARTFTRLRKHREQNRR